MPCLWHGDIIIGQPLVSSQLSHFLNWQYPKDPGNAAWGEDKSLMLYLRDENSGQWEWGQRNMRQGMTEEMQVICYHESMASQGVNRNTDVSFCLKGCLPTRSIHRPPLRRVIGRRKGTELNRRVPHHLLFLMGQRSLPGEFTPGTSVALSSLSCISLKCRNGTKRPNFLWSTHLPLQKTKGRWQMLDTWSKEKSLSVWQWFDECFFSSVRRI